MLTSTVLALTLTGVPMSVYDFSMQTIDGKDVSLSAYKGKAVMIVNTASQCGYTPQYKSLEALYQQYKDKGFEILAFPSNDFGGQEPGTNEEIKEFCASKYSVTFPLFDKLHVKGAEQHPLYAELTGKTSPFPGDVKWNFSKFLVSRDGKILKRFDSKVAPDAPELIAAVEAALSVK